MAGLYRFLSLIGGRRAVMILGALYIAFAHGWTLLQIAGAITISELVVFVLIAGPGAVLLYLGYRLPQFDIRPELYPVAAGWCFGGLLLMVLLMGFYSLQPDESVDSPSTIMILSALASVAGLAAGIHNAQARTRTRELEDAVDRLEASNERLERYQQYTDDILDTIDDVFYVLDEGGSLKRWNESLSAVTGYADEEIASMTAADFFEEEDREAALAAVRDGFGSGSTHVELAVRTKDGETIPFEFVASTLEDPSGETVLAGIGRDVTERVERERRLEELVDRLEASNERLEQFAYAASHDLQEPLRMVSSYLRLIEQRYADALDEEGREFLAFAVDGADRMRTMIDGLLQYSRVDAGGASFEDVDLNTVLEDVRNDLQVKIEETDAEITAESLPRVTGDRDQLRQVFQNLLDNAIEYSGDESPRVHISAERNGSEWEVAVQDEGIGLDPDNADRIFEVFERLQPSDNGSGTGIGLALCERIVERHGGEIRVSSDPGEGTTFTFTLPVNARRDTGE